MKLQWAASRKNKNSGFTIVELLIVVVVIAILAAITIVAFNGIQSRARDSSRDTHIRQLKIALEMYKEDNGNYPSVGTDNSGYAITTLGVHLIPAYLPLIPQDLRSPATVYSYVRGPLASNSYAIYVPGYESKPACKTGMNVNTGWWGAGIPLC